MTRYIDAEKFEKEMCHEAFETDSDMQKWDRGCWIRYKMFENCIAQQPTADVVEVVRCTECAMHSKCIMEDTFITVGITDGYCRVGRKVEKMAVTDYCTGICKECMKYAPYEYCCKFECGEHEFCRGCQKAGYLKK